MTIHIRIKPDAFDAGKPLARFASVSVPPIGYTSNILENGSFPAAPVLSENIKQKVSVHVSQTTGSSYLRDNVSAMPSDRIDPVYGINVTIEGMYMNEATFETALKDATGGAFLSNLQDLVARGVIEVLDDGVALTPLTLETFNAA